MAVADRVNTTLRDRPGAITAVLSVIGYALVGSALAGTLPLFPSLSRDTVLLFSHLIAGVNALALGAILVGVYYIRKREYRKHRAAMLTAFSLIMVFLVLYLWKTGGGFEKAITATGLPKLAYLGMLGVHIFLSVVSVPVVLYAVILGLTHSPEELKETRHAQVGRVAAAAWSVSLFLGIVTYVLLNHVYGWEPLHSGAALLLVAAPRLRPRRWR
jgi:putative membrane protein